MIKTLYLSFPTIINMLGMILFDFFIFSIIGCFMFKRVKTGMIIDSYNNFSNIFYSMMILFKCATADNWTAIIIDTNNVLPNCV